MRARWRLPALLPSRLQQRLRHSRAMRRQQWRSKLEEDTILNNVHRTSYRVL